MAFPHADLSDERLANLVLQAAGVLQVSMVTELQRRQTERQLQLSKESMEESRKRHSEMLESSEKLNGHTNRLVEQVSSLKNIAEEQRRLAVTLDGQTRVLIRLTVVIAVLTLVLVAKEIVSLVGVGK